MTYAIEKGVVQPAARHTDKWNFPLMEMEIGDSFLVPAVDGKAQEKVRASLGYRNRKLKSQGRRFIARVVAGGVRIWRVQ